MAYIGKGLDNGVRNQFVFAATQGQTSFSGSDSDGKTLAMTDILYTDCYQNGVKLKPTTDYTVTSTTLTLVSAASLNDVINIVSFDTFAVPDTVSASTGGTFGGGITATTGTFSGAVSGSTISGSVTSGTTATLSSSQATSNIDILKLDATGTSSSSNLKFNVASGAQGQIRLGGNNDISIHNTSSDTTRLTILGAGGLTFNGDTAAANALDDYEEGTWTPAFTASGATFGYSVQKGSYVKIGALVTLWYNITLSSISTSANSVFISGLPFSTYSISELYAGGGLGAYANINLGTGTTLAYQIPASSGTQIELKEIGDNMGENGVVASELASNTFIRGSIFYRAA